MSDSFDYKSFSVSDDRRTVLLTYSLHHGSDDYDFTETLRFPIALPANDTINRALRALHLALGVSYYKIFISPQIVHPYQMDSAEADFWNQVWRGGLGEFLYVNKLDPAQLATFSVQDGMAFAESAADEADGALMGIGGGKDSIVAGEILKELGVAVDGFVMATGEQRGQAAAVADIMRVPLHAVERRLDPSLLEVQELPGAYKGHIPISLMFGLVGATLALATDKKYVVVANEASASIPRVNSQHGSVNHQWSKSFEFEQAFQQFVKNHIGPVDYFSAVRQLTSVAVAKAFSRYPRYFTTFTSDNSIFRIDPRQRPDVLWSLESPKSLSSFMLLSPWLAETDLLKIFGRDFLDETSLETLFNELTGLEGEPPLDCVGTVEELVLSLNLASQQQKFTSSYLMELAREKNIVRDGNWNVELAEMFELHADQALPAELQAGISRLLEQHLA